MGIEVASSFTRKAAVPLDDATIIADLTARDAIASGIRYEGMIVYVTAEATNFQLVGGIANENWQELSGAGGNLSDLEDVDLGTPSESEVLTFNDNTGKWVNRAPSGGGGVNLMPSSLDAVKWDDSSYFTLTDNSTTPRSFPTDLKIQSASGDGTDKFIRILSKKIDKDYRGRRIFVSFNATYSAYKDFYEAVGWEAPEFRIYDFTNSEYLHVYPLSGFVTDPANTDNKTALWSDGEYVAYFDLPETTEQVYFEIFYHYAVSNSQVEYLSKAIRMTPDMPTLGTIMTMPESWTPTGTWTTNTTYTGKKWRVGHMGHYEVKVKVSGAPTSAHLRINMPPGEAIDYDFSSDPIKQVGKGYYNDANGSFYYGGVFCIGDTGSSAVALYSYNTSGSQAVLGQLTQANPFTAANNDYYVVRWSVPIVGWDVGPMLSSVDLSLKTAYVLASGNAGQSITAESTDIPFIGVDDKWGQWSGTAFSPKESGLHRISASIAFTDAQSRNIQVYEDGSVIARLTAPASTGGVHGYVELFLQKGKSYTLRSHGDGGTLSTTGIHKLVIARTPDYQMFAAYNKYVGGKVYRDVAQTGINTNNSFVKLTFNKVDHTEGVTWDGTNNRWVIESPGRYQFGASTTIAGTNVVNGTRFVHKVFKNNGADVLDSIGNGQAGAASQTTFIHGGSSSPLFLNAGDNIELYVLGSANNSSNTLSTSAIAVDNRFWIRKVD